MQSNALGLFRALSHYSVYGSYGREAMSQAGLALRLRFAGSKVTANIAQALIRTLFLYIQNSISHSTTRTATARRRGSRCPEVPTMPCVKMLTQ